jgi:acetylornithine deacetylase/succinyl-diaminopimelate desuccinylase-like protein
MRTLSQKFWPGLPIIPTMAVGGMHGLNERLSVKSFYDGQRFLDEQTRVVAE